MDRQIGHPTPLAAPARPRQFLARPRPVAYPIDMGHHIVTPEIPSDADRDAILAVLTAYNSAHAPSIRREPLALLVKDTEGTTVGGLWGRSAYDWMFVEYLAVPEALRGQAVGTDLMRRAERIARDRGCVGIWLDTFAFQARGFYEKLGFTVFGTIPDFPVGSARHFLAKRFTD